MGLHQLEQSDLLLDDILAVPGELDDLIRFGFLTQSHCNLLNARLVLQYNQPRAIAADRKRSSRRRRRIDPTRESSVPRLGRRVRFF